MSEHKLTSTINREIKSINQMIDMKIIQGAPYKREAKRHKLLVSMLHDLEKRQVRKPLFQFASFLF